MDRVHSGLIERLEAAEIGSRELDAEIVVQLLAPPSAVASISRFNGEWCVYHGERNGEPRLWQPYGRDAAISRLPLTTCLDAALALAERVLPFWAVDLSSWGPMSRATLNECDEEWWHRSKHARIEAQAETLPLALCASVLKAKTARYEPQANEPNQSQHKGEGEWAI